MNVFKKLFSVVLYWGLRIFVKESEARELVDCLEASDDVKVRKIITRDEMNESEIHVAVKEQTDQKDFDRIKDAVWQAYKVVTQQSPDLRIPRKRTYLLRGNYTPTDKWKGGIYFGFNLTFIYLAPIIISLAGGVFFHWGLGITLGLIYTAVNFLSSFHSLKSGSDRGGEVATIYFWGIPIRDHGTYGGFYLKFWWEKVVFSFGDYTEIEFRFNLPCFDNVKRECTIQVGLRLKRPWGAKDILSPEDVRLPEDFDWKKSGGVEAFKRLITQKLTAQFSVDFESALQIVLMSIYPEQQADVEAAEKNQDQRKRIQSKHNMISTYTRLVQKALLLVTKLAIFQDEVLEVRRLQLHIRLGEKELAAAERKKTAGDKADEAMAVFDEFLAKGDKLFPPTEEDVKRAEIQSSEGEKITPHSEKAIEYASRHLDKYQEREGLAASGSGLAAGRKSGTR